MAMERYAFMSVVLLSVLFLICRLQTATAENLALNQPVEANFAVLGGNAKLALVVDGNDTTCMIERQISNQPLTVSITSKLPADLIQIRKLPTENVVSTPIVVTSYQDGDGGETVAQYTETDSSHTTFFFWLERPTHLKKVEVQAGGQFHLALCEIRVFSACEPGTYGEYCNKTCDESCVDDACQRMTGNCLNGCKEGKEGPGCRATCPTGSYGKYCDKQCNSGCADDVCERTSGVCGKGCKEGFVGVNCSEAASTTKFIVTGTTQPESNHGEGSKISGFLTVISLMWARLFIGE